MLSRNAYCLIQRHGCKKTPKPVLKQCLELNRHGHLKVNVRMVYWIYWIVCTASVLRFFGMLLRCSQVGCSSQGTALHETRSSQVSSPRHRRRTRPLFKSEPDIFSCLAPLHKIICQMVWIICLQLHRLSHRLLFTSTIGDVFFERRYVKMFSIR